MKSGMNKWRRIFRHWEKSGLSRKESCRQKQLATSTFYYWQKKLKEADGISHNLGTKELVKLQIPPTKRIVRKKRNYFRSTGCSLMLLDFEKLNFYVRPGVTDMRKQINGLFVFADEEMNQNPGSGSLFLFCSRNRKLLKYIYWDRK